MNESQFTIWTIGHSTRTLDTFLEMLFSFEIQLVVDIRTYPGSRRYPHFNKETLQVSLRESNIDYQHMPELGGRRKPNADSHNTIWRHAAFRGYADYMETSEFKNAIDRLKEMATKYKTVYMCSEAVWWKCHRALVSDHLKTQHWNVLHIMNVGEVKQHPFTKAARVVRGNLFYHE